jgi:hypothetical protein
MNFNKRCDSAFDHLLANRPEFDRPYSLKKIKKNQPREIRMSDLGLQPT